MEQAIEIRERVADKANPFNAFRAALKEVKKVQAGEAGDLWKAAGEAIQQRKSVAAVAGPAQSPSAETQDGQGQEEPIEEEDELEQSHDEDHAPGESAQPPGLEEEQCCPLATIKQNHLFQYDDSEAHSTGLLL